ACGRACLDELASLHFRSKRALATKITESQRRTRADATPRLSLWSLYPLLLNYVFQSDMAESLDLGLGTQFRHGLLDRLVLHHLLELRLYFAVTGHLGGTLVVEAYHVPAELALHR